MMDRSPRAERKTASQPAASAAAAYKIENPEVLWTMASGGKLSEFESCATVSDKISGNKITLQFEDGRLRVGLRFKNSFLDGMSASQYGKAGFKTQLRKIDSHLTVGEGTQDIYWKETSSGATSQPIKVAHFPSGQLRDSDFEYESSKPVRDQKSFVKELERALALLQTCIEYTCTSQKKEVPSFELVVRPLRSLVEQYGAAAGQSSGPEDQKQNSLAPLKAVPIPERRKPEPLAHETDTCILYKPGTHLLNIAGLTEAVAALGMFADAYLRNQTVNKFGFINRALVVVSGEDRTLNRELVEGLAGDLSAVLAEVEPIWATDLRGLLSRVIEESRKAVRDSKDLLTDRIVIHVQEVQLPPGVDFSLAEGKFLSGISYDDLDEVMSRNSAWQDIVVVFSTSHTSVLDQDILNRSCCVSTEFTVGAAAEELRESLIGFYQRSAGSVTIPTAKDGAADAELDFFGVAERLWTDQCRSASAFREVVEHAVRIKADRLSADDEQKIQITAADLIESWEKLGRR